MNGNSKRRRKKVKGKRAREDGNKCNNDQFVSAKRHGVDSARQNGTAHLQRLVQLLLVSVHEVQIEAYGASRISPLIAAVLEAG